MAPLTLAQQNDLFRSALGFGAIARAIPGRVVMTAALAALPARQLARVLRAAATFSAFTPDNDPYGEHDCAVFIVGGERFIWKVDYYADETLTFGAEEPAVRCYRVLTIMCASDY